MEVEKKERVRARQWIRKSNHDCEHLMVRRDQILYNWWAGGGFGCVYVSVMNVQNPFNLSADPQYKNKQAAFPRPKGRHRIVMVQLGWIFTWEIKTMLVLFMVKLTYKLHYAVWSCDLNGLSVSSHSSQLIHCILCRICGFELVINTANSKHADGYNRTPLMLANVRADPRELLRSDVRKVTIGKSGKRQ